MVGNRLDNVSDVFGGKINSRSVNSLQFGRIANVQTPEKNAEARPKRIRLWQRIHSSVSNKDGCEDPKSAVLFMEEV